MSSPPTSLPSAWRFALIGALASLPIGTVVDRLPNSAVPLGAAVMLIGGFVAGATATLRSSDPDAAGLRAGFLGGVLAVATFVVTAGVSAAWPDPRLAFFAVASVVALCLAPLFGLVSGRLGGWTANAVATRWSTSANAS